MEILADTTLLIDLQRGDPGARDLLRKNGSAEFLISIITVGELVPGFLRLGEAALSIFLQPFPILQTTEKTAWLYGENFAKLKSSGRLIGSNDLWIAALALERKLPIATRNVNHFQQVAGLEVLTY